MTCPLCINSLVDIVWIISLVERSDSLSTQKRSYHCFSSISGKLLPSNMEHGFDIHELNQVLRISYASSNYNVIESPAQQQPWENDHFIEVQHFVDVLISVLKFQGKYDNWYNVPIGEFLDLSSFVNDHRNLFQINKKDNQEKKKIPLEKYSTNQTIQTYLKYKVKYKGRIVTVKDMVEATLREMSVRNTPLSDLTRDVGKMMLQTLGW